MAYPRQSVELAPKEFVGLARSLFVSPLASGVAVRRFEDSLAKLLGVRFAISFGSQRSGALAVLKALSPRDGDESIVPAYTFFSVPACVVLAGFRPVFVDVDRATWNLDPSQVRSAVTSRTRAIIVTHLNGCPADVAALVRIAAEHGLVLVEDCAQALGAHFQSKPVGSFGIGCFSFGEGKNLYTMGGGLVTTEDENLAGRLRDFQSQGRDPGFLETFAKIGRLLLYRAVTTPLIFSWTAFPAIYLASLRNGRIDTEQEHCLNRMPADPFSTKLSNVQAALGSAQLERLEERNQRRVENAGLLTEMLRGVKDLGLPPDPKDRTHLYLHYAVCVKDREGFVRRLIQRGVDAQRDYCSFCPSLPDFRNYAPSGLKAPQAQAVAGNIAYLPNQPSLKSMDMRRIACHVREILSK